jgi:hypothetical protein
MVRKEAIRAGTLPMLEFTKNEGRLPCKKEEMSFLKKTNTKTAQNHRILQKKNIRRVSLFLLASLFKP